VIAWAKVTCRVGAIEAEDGHPAPSPEREAEEIAPTVMPALPQSAKERAWACRHTVLVTQDGCETLTGAAPSF
jgi:hypothetical protein